MTCERSLKLAKANADRKVIANRKVIDAQMLLVAKVAKRTSRAATVVVDRMDNVLPKVVDRMASRASRRVTVIDVPRGKVDEVRCRGSLNCSTAITTASSARTNSIGSRKSLLNWIGTKTVS